MDVRPARRWVRIFAGAVATLAATACGPREWIMPAVGLDPPVFRDFGEGFDVPLSRQTGQPVNGFGGNGGGLTRTPLILVHGTTVSAAFWRGLRDHYRERGYTDDELWAVGYGWNNGRYFDSNEMSAVTLDRFVNRVTEYLSAKAGRPIHQFDLVGHSLGNTIVRHWAKQTNSFHRVRAFVGNSGVNRGSWTMNGNPRGPNRISAFEMWEKSPWLEQLNRGGETPGATNYMTLYDGTGWGDLFYPPPYVDSPTLRGAHNVAYNVEEGGLLGHLELATHKGPQDRMFSWFAEAHEPLPEAGPPPLRQDGGVVRSEDADLYCESGIVYPTLRSRPLRELRMDSDLLYTCFAYSQRTHLSSPMARFKAPVARIRTEPLTLRASPGSGVYEQPQHVTLEASDPDAFIVYSTVTGRINSGMPLYSDPVYVHAPLTLTAVAYSPDGRVSEPISLDYDISLEYVEAVNAPERQFDPKAPVEYEGRRPLGR